MEIDSWSLVGASVINAALGLVFWLASARLFPIADVGRASTMIAAATALASVSLLASGGFLERFLPVMRRVGQIRVVVWASVISASLAAITSTVYSLLPSSEALFVQSWHRPVFVTSVVILVLFSLYDSVLIGLQRGRWTAAKNVTHSVLKLLVVLLLAWCGMSLLGVEILLAWVIPAAVLVIVVQLFLVFSRARVFSGTESSAAAAPPLIDAARYYLISVGWLFSQILPALFLPLLVASIAGLESAAFFNISWVIVSASIMMMSALGGPFVARAADPNSDLAAATRSMITMTIGVSVVRFLGVAVAGPVALLFYGRPYFDQGWVLLVLMGVAHLIGGSAFLFGALSRVYARIGYPMMVQAMASVLVVTLVWWLLPTYGLLGVGIAYLIQDLLIFLVTIIPLTRILPRALKGQR
ncbi:lipopolysaccharide biosynthesis protein [Corynebacterium alimapuense]|uniref:lipopolysaccharide biosynthesis protein n=1 Tax=Corynebacterium alimapuense TaxID=1576874 RepID=UPI001401D43D|nr:hypothetical protein [Corynebacterium alimapuense]